MQLQNGTGYAIKNLQRNLSTELTRFSYSERFDEFVNGTIFLHPVDNYNRSPFAVISLYLAS